MKNNKIKYVLVSTTEDSPNTFYMPLNEYLEYFGTEYSTGLIYEFTDEEFEEAEAKLRKENE